MIYTWPVTQFVEALHLPDDVAITGIKLSLDGAFVEARVEQTMQDTVDLFIERRPQSDLFDG